MGRLTNAWSGRDVKYARQTPPASRSSSTLGVMKLRLAALLASALLVAGCFPYHFTARPGVSGVVVDAATSKPIPNAAITLSESAGKAETSADTDASGRFRIASRQVWGIYIVTLDTFPFRTNATISALGYESVSIPVWTSVLDSRDAHLGEIHLKPTSLP